MYFHDIKYIEISRYTYFRTGLSELIFVISKRDAPCYISSPYLKARLTTVSI